MNAVFRREKDGYSLRLAEKEDAGRYYSDNFHPLDGEDAVFPGRSEDGSSDVVLMSVRKSERDELLKKSPLSDRGGRENGRGKPCGSV